MANKENTSAIPMAIKLCRVVTYGQQTSYTRSRCLLIKWSLDKCKTLYLHFKNIFGHQTWQSSNLQISNSPQLQGYVNFWLRGHVTNEKKIISKLPQYLWPPSYMIFLSHGHVTDIKPYICTSAVLMITKLGRVVICGVGTQPSNSRDLMITRSRKKWKKTFLHLHSTYGHRTW